jgi:ElaB/YqjD/DUF883 family membrane-anchored ribosome-binding protein
MGNVADSATADLTQRARNAAAAVAEGRSATADGLASAASAIHDRADDLPEGNTVRHFARATAERLNTSADYVRSHDAKRMMADVETFIKSNPGPALVASAALGFLLGRALSRD